VEQENREENINISGNDIVNTTETGESPEESETRLPTGQPKLVPVLDLPEDVLENEESMNELEQEFIKKYLLKRFGRR
jgi:hypothetical protein